MGWLFLQHRWSEVHWMYQTMSVVQEADGEWSTHDARKVTKSSSHFLLGFPQIPGMPFSSRTFLGPGLHWGGHRGLPPPGHTSCATSGGCQGCDGVTLTSSGFQSLILHVPEPSGAGLSRRHHRLSPKATFPWMQPTAIPQGKKNIPATIAALRDVVNNIITEKLFGPCCFFNSLLGFGSLAPIVPLPAHAKAGEFAWGAHTFREMLFQGLLGKTKPGTTGFTRQRSVQPPVPACCHVPQTLPGSPDTTICQHVHPRQVGNPSCAPLGQQIITGEETTQKQRQ